MTILEPLLVGMNQIRTNKLRSLLSLLGILIAVGAFTGIVSIGEGLQYAITGEFEEMGGYSIIASWAPNPWYRNESGVWVRRTWEEYLTSRDMEAIMAETDKVEYIIPNVRVGGDDWTMRYRNATFDARIISTSPHYWLAENWRVAKGRFLTFRDMIDHAKVCVLGSETAENLFGPGVDPINREVKFGRSRYTVVGVMEPKQFFDAGYNTRAMVPITTVQRRVLGHDHLQYILVKAKSPEYVDEVAEAMRRVYRRRHEHGEEFEIQTGQSQLAQINRVLFIMKAVAGSIAGISLLVGGIGIMNIMLVSVTERTHEIGIRKALGATRSTILWQFVIEALVLCVMGGILGIGLGLMFGKGISLYISSVTKMGFPSFISPKLSVLAVVFSLLVGLVFGVYPAWRASRLDPVDALRYE